VNSGREDDFQAVHAFADKNFRRFGTDVVRELTQLAPNYRMTELQGAVGIAQLKKLPLICERRRILGDRITQGITGLPGIRPHQVDPGNECTYWFYMFRLEETELTCSRAEFSAALQAEGIPNAPGYIPDVVYMQPLFRNHSAYKGSRFPFDLTGIQYERGLCPTAESILQTAVRIAVSEFYTDRDVEEIVEAIAKVARHYRKG